MDSKHSIFVQNSKPLCGASDYLQPYCIQLSDISITLSNTSQKHLFEALTSRGNECAAVRNEPSTSHLLISSWPALTVCLSSLEHRLPRHDHTLSPVPSTAQLTVLTQYLFNECLLHWFSGFHFPIHSLSSPLSPTPLISCPWPPFCYFFCFIAIRVSAQEKTAEEMLLAPVQTLHMKHSAESTLEQEYQKGCSNFQIIYNQANYHI